MKKRAGKMISLSLAVALAMTAAPVTVMADENVTASIQTADTETENNQDEKTNSENTAENKENSDLENGKTAESEKMEEILERADRALYCAKRASKGGCCLWRDQTDEM